MLSQDSFASSRSRDLPPSVAAVLRLVVATAVVASVGADHRLQGRTDRARRSGRTARLPRRRTSGQARRLRRLGGHVARPGTRAAALVPAARPARGHCSRTGCGAPAVRSRAADRDARCRRARRRDDQGDQLVSLVRGAAAARCAPVRAWTTWLPGPVIRSTSWARPSISVAAPSGWLCTHRRFGFALSFPASRSPELTCYSPEPWHYRYFGRDRAAAIAESGLSPREWLWAEQAGRRLVAG